MHYTSNRRLNEPQNDLKETDQTKTSIGGKPELDVMRKPPDRDQVSVDVRSMGTDDSLACSYKKGGKCIKHGTKGTRMTNSVKVWTKKKDGLFAYVWKTKVSYVCHVSGVAKSDELSSRSYGVAKSNEKTSDKGPVKKTKISEALGGKSDNTGKVSGVCGADYRSAGSDTRESFGD